MTSCASPPTRGPATARRSGCAERLVVRRAARGDTRSSATYSPCGAYRYRLSRIWGPGPRIAWIMLNPSTASEVANDATIARCEARSRALGYGGLIVVNLFAFRATRPADLWRAADPVGPETDRLIAASVRQAALVLCAWGVHGRRHGRDAAVLGLLGNRPRACLGTTRARAPRHPLYVPNSVEPQPF